MSIVTRLDENGITILDVHHDMIIVNFSGSAVIVKSRRLITTNQSCYVEPNEDTIKRCTQQLKRTLKSLLENFMLGLQSPRIETPKPLVLAHCMYNGVLWCEVDQPDHGPACLHFTDQSRAVEPVGRSIDGCHLRHYETHQFYIKIDSISLNCVQATVNWTNQLSYTCLALRDLSFTRLMPKANTVAWLHPTLSAMFQANRLRETMDLERRMTLRIPKLHGLVFHTHAVGPMTLRPLVGGLLDHMPAARSWDSLRRLRRPPPPPQATQKLWAEQIRFTVELLHRHGIFWGGKVGCPTDSLGALLLASVDIDGDGEPWLVRNFGAAAGEDARGQDLRAVMEMMVLADHQYDELRWCFAYEGQS